MKAKQFRICYFLEKSCEENHHEVCDEVYEGLGIRAICNCKCHEENKKLPTVRSRAAEQSLDDFVGLSECIAT